MIFRKGEFFKLLTGSIREMVGKVGQIDKVVDLDFGSFPYCVVMVNSIGETIKFNVSANEIQLLKYREAELEISDYLKKVRR